MSDRSLTLETRREEAGRSTLQPGLAGSLGLLFSRVLLFAAFQGLIALALRAAGEASPWIASRGWWMWAITFTNFISLGLLFALLRREGSSLWALYRPEREGWLRDLGLASVFLLLAGVMAVAPVFVLSPLLFGDMESVSTLMFSKLPLGWAIAGVILFPLTQGLAEIPTYAGYIMPRLKDRTGSWWLAVGLAGLMLAAQHMAAPLIFDGRFLAYRFLMFLPFALLTCATLAWKPRLLPYLMVIHVLIDIQPALMMLP